jgi:hypothetical protein
MGYSIDYFMECDKPIIDINWSLIYTAYFIIYSTQSAKNQWKYRDFRKIFLNKSVFCKTICSWIFSNNNLIIYLI